jgi:hypothetical protein
VIILLLLLALLGGAEDPPNVPKEVVTGAPVERDSQDNIDRTNPPPSGLPDPSPFSGGGSFQLERNGDDVRIGKR